MDCKRYFSSGMFVFVCLGFFCVQDFVCFFQGEGFFVVCLGFFLLGFLVWLFCCFVLVSSWLVGWLIGFVVVFYFQKFGMLGCFLMKAQFCGTKLL